MGRVSDYYEGLIEYLYGPDGDATPIETAANSRQVAHELPKQPKPQEKDSKGE